MDGADALQPQRAGSGDVGTCDREPRYDQAALGGLHPTDGEVGHDLFGNDGAEVMNRASMAKQVMEAPMAGCGTKGMKKGGMVKKKMMGGGMVKGYKKGGMC